MRLLKNCFVTILAFLVMTSGIVVHAEGLPTKKASYEKEACIAKIVERFMDVFESIEINSNDKMDQIRGMSSLSTLECEHSYLNMVSLLLDRNEILSRYTDNDLTEYKK